MGGRHTMGYEHMIGWGGGWGGGHWFGYGLIGLVIVVVVVALLATRSRTGQNDLNNPRSEDRSLAILRERYARGEIDKTEFEARKRDLS